MQAQDLVSIGIRVAVTVYVGLCVAAWVLPSHLLYLPQTPSYRDGPRIVKLEAAPGVRIATAYDPVPDSRFTVLMSHGNAEDLGDLRWFVAKWKALGVSVLTYDYEGYGASEGKPSEAALYRDIDAVYDHATRDLGIPPDRLLVYGRSLGGGPTVDLASRRPVAGLILESTFASAFRVITRVRLLPWDQFESLAKMPLVKAPVLVIHGENDALIPIAQGRALFDAARGPKRALWVKGGEHANAPIVAGADYESAITSFLALLPP